MCYVIHSQASLAVQNTVTKKKPSHVNPAASYLNELLQAGYSLADISNQSGLHLTTLQRVISGKAKKSKYMTFRCLITTYCRLLKSNNIQKSEN